MLVVAVSCFIDFCLDQQAGAGIAANSTRSLDRDPDWNRFSQFRQTRMSSPARRTLDRCHNYIRRAIRLALWLALCMPQLFYRSQCIQFLTTLSMNALQGQIFTHAPPVNGASLRIWSKFACSRTQLAGGGGGEVHMRHLPPPFFEWKSTLLHIYTFNIIQIVLP